MCRDKGGMVFAEVLRRVEEVAVFCLVEPITERGPFARAASRLIRFAHSANLIGFADRRISFRQGYDDFQFGGVKRVSLLIQFY